MENNQLLLHTLYSIMKARDESAESTKTAADENTILSTDFLAAPVSPTLNSKPHSNSTTITQTNASPPQTSTLLYTLSTIGAPNLATAAQSTTITAKSTSDTKIIADEARARAEMLFQLMEKDLVHHFNKYKAVTFLTHATLGLERMVFLKAARELFLKNTKTTLAKRIKLSCSYKEIVKDVPLALFLSRLEYQLNLPAEFFNLEHNYWAKALQPVPRTEKEVDEEIIIRTVAQEMYEKLCFEGELYDSIFGITRFNGHITSIHAEYNQDLCCAWVTSALQTKDPTERFPFPILSSEMQSKFQKHFPVDTIIQRLSVFIPGLLIKPNVIAATTAITAMVAAAPKPAVK